MPHHWPRLRRSCGMTCTPSAVKIGAEYRNTMVCAAVVCARASPSRRNSSENSKPRPSPLGSVPSANERGPSRMSTIVPKNSAEQAKRIASCIVGATSVATPFITTCCTPQTILRTNLTAVARASSGWRFVTLVASAAALTFGSIHLRSTGSTW